MAASYLSTLDQPPPGHRIETSFGLVEITCPIQISNKGIIKGLLERNRNEHQEAVDQLQNSAPEGANAILGVRVTSATQQFGKDVFLYLTYIGTAVQLIEA
jgi:uncharacterized protein YbjQ (UPF0145 family)